jgi:hypothetical protein
MIERDEYLMVAAMDEASATAFVAETFGIAPERVARVVDMGEAKGDRYKDGARIFHVYTVPE